MNDKSKNILITVGIFLSIGLFSWWWFSTFKKVEEEKRTFVPEYYSNDYFILEEFLKSLGVETSIGKSAVEIMRLNENTGTVALFDSPNIFSNEINSSLKDWVDKGGTLITNIPSRTKGKQYDFFSEFGVENKEVDTPEIYTEDYFSDEPIVQDYLNLLDEDYNPGDNVSDCRTHNNALIDCGNSKNIIAASDYTVLASNSDLNAYISIPYGLGHIIVINRTSAYQNKLISNIDNAYFFTSMLNTKNNKLLIFNRSGKQSLFKVLWNQFKLQIILLFTLISGLIWSLFQRFGPIREIELESRQDLRRHLQASADYLWSVDLLKQNFVQLRNEINHSIMRRLGKKLDLQDPDMRETFLRHIEEHTSELSKNEINQAFFGDLPANEKELIIITQRLQMIRSKL